MKTLRAALIAASLIHLSAAETPPPLAAANKVAPETSTSPSDKAEAAPAEPTPEGMLKLNFRSAPLDIVLDYLSEAAGFIIVMDTKVTGKVDVWSNHPVTKDEAVDLLNSILSKNNCAAIRNGRTLTIVSREDAKNRLIPVRTGADPAQIPTNDEMVTQIIPIRFVEAAQLVKDLAAMAPPQATILANEAGNSIIVTDTQASIHHLVEIIKAIDSSAEEVTEVRVFHLKNSDPSEMADLLGNLFPDDSRSQGNSQTPVRFGGFGGFGGNRGGFGGFGGGGFGGFGGFGGGGNRGGAAATGANGSGDRIKKHLRVLAVADQRTSSLIVSAARDLIDQISNMINQLDENPANKQRVFVKKLNNADPQQVQQVLQGIFQKYTTTRNQQTTLQNSPLVTRQTTQSQTTAVGNSTGFGSGSSGGNRGGGGGGGGF